MSHADGIDGAVRGYRRRDIDARALRKTGNLARPSCRAGRPGQCPGAERGVAGRGSAGDEIPVGDFLGCTVSGCLDQPCAGNVCWAEAPWIRGIQLEHVVIDISCPIYGEWTRNESVWINRAERVDASNYRSASPIQLKNRASGAWDVNEVVRHGSMEDGLPAPESTRVRLRLPVAGKIPFLDQLPGFPVKALLVPDLEVPRIGSARGFPCRWNSGSRWTARNPSPGLKLHEHIVANCEWRLIVRQQIPTLLGLLGGNKRIIDEVRQVAGQDS